MYLLMLRHTFTHNKGKRIHFTDSIPLVMGVYNCVSQVKYTIF